MVNSNRQEDIELISDSKLRLFAKGDWVFMATLCNTLQTVLDDTISYGATDGKKLYINPYTFRALTKDEQVFLLAHETLHVAYLHMARKKENHLKWNYATDYVINQFLVDSGFTMIQGSLLDSKYQGLSADEVYDLLPDSKIDNSLGIDIIANDDIDDIQTNIMVSAQIAIEKNTYGNLPEELQRYINNLTKPVYDWKAILRKYLYATYKHLTTWFKPNRRYLSHGMYLPTLDGKSLSALIAIDVSSSINYETLDKFICELHGLFKLIKIHEIEIIQFNTYITKTNKVKTLKELEKIEFIGYGGTDVKPAIDYYNNSKHKICIILTDGEFNHNFETKKNMIWLIYDNPNFKTNYGKVIYYDSNR